MFSKDRPGANATLQFNILLELLIQFAEKTRNRKNVFKFIMGAKRGIKVFKFSIVQRFSS